jgi:hypothetical protein
MPYWVQCLLVRFEWMQRIVFRYRCPYPVIADHSARACVEGGHCGCDNQSRYRPIPPSHSETP